MYHIIEQWLRYANEHITNHIIYTISHSSFISHASCWTEIYISHERIDECLTLPEVGTDVVPGSCFRAHSFSQSTGIIGLVSSINLSSGQSWSQPGVHKTLETDLATIVLHAYKCVHLFEATVK